LASESLHRLTYDATIDDAVDVSLRIVRRTHAFRTQMQWSVIAAGIGSALAFFAAWMYIVGTSLLNVVLGSVVGILFGIVFAAIFRRFFEKEILKQQRKVVAEQFGGKATLQSELELRPDAVWVRQAGMEMLFPWTVCTSVRNNAGDIEMTFTPGLCVIPNRHFASAAERQAFLETARRLSAKAAMPTPAA
jgi:hypothetical protein